MAETSYAMMLLPTADDAVEREPVQLGHGLITWRGRLADVLAPNAERDWVSWMGTNEWNAIAKNRQRFVLLPDATLHHNHQPLEHRTG